MLGLRRTAGIVALLLACSAPAAEAGIQPSRPPAPCDDQLFSDQFGTSDPDALEAPSRPQRLWGFGAEDRLPGSATRATCLFGGRGDDVLDLQGGGGVAYGEGGDDWLLGSPLS